MTRVLIVEDEPQLRRALGINLRAHQYEVDAVADGAGALRAAAANPPDLVILDLGLPDMDGNEVAHGLRGWTRIPIIGDLRWKPCPCGQGGNVAWSGRF
jgi:two-component system KDP operon response regulator KdpE